MYKLAYWMSKKPRTNDLAFNFQPKQLTSYSVVTYIGSNAEPQSNW